MSKIIYQIITGIVFILFLYSCKWEQLQPQLDCSANPVELEIIATEDVACGETNGSFIVSAKGGEGPYSYTSDIGNNNSGEFSNLTAGSYSIIVTDSKGCSADLIISLQNLGGVNLDEIIISDAGCGTSTGAISISASGGQEPYLYSINGGESQEDNVFNSLGSGNYEITVQDQTGCEITQEINITSGVSFQNNIQSIIATNCAISGCHNGSVSPNLTTFSTIQSRASAIQARTESRSMPRGRSLSQSEIDLIACWVEDGALNN